MWLYFASRKTRGVDFGLLTKPDLLFHEEGLRKEDLDLTCQLRYQQSEVEVYARFVLDDQDRKQYYIHRKALFRVTDDMLERLRVADVSVAELRGNIVVGLKPGRSEIQVSHSKVYNNLLYTGWGFGSNLKWINSKWIMLHEVYIIDHHYCPPRSECPERGT